MAILSDIWNFIKRNTLDRTNLDEQIVSGVKNFFNAPSQQVLQRRQSTFQYNPPPPPPIIQPPKLPLNNIENRINLLRQKLASANNQMFQNAKDLVINRGINPIQQSIQNWATANPVKAQAIQTWEPLFKPIQTAKKSLASQNINKPTQFVSKLLNSVKTDFPEYTKNVSNAFFGEKLGPIINTPTKYFQNVTNSGIDTIANVKNTISDIGRGNFKQAGSDLLKTAESALNTAFRLRPTTALPWLGYEMLKSGSAARIRNGSYYDQLKAALDAFTGDKTVGLGTSLTKNKKLEQFLNTSEGIAFLAHGLYQGWKAFKNWNDLRIKTNILKNNQYYKDMDIMNKYGLNEKDFLNKDLLKSKYRDIIKRIYPRKLGEDDEAFKEFQLVFNRMVGNYYKGVPKTYTPKTISPLLDKRTKSLNEIMATTKLQNKSFTTPVKQKGNLGEIISKLAKQNKIGATLLTKEDILSKIEPPIADWVKIKNDNGLSLTQTALVRDLATAMKKSTNNHDLTKSIPKLIKIAKNNPESMYPAIRASADFSIKGNLKPWWKQWLKTGIPKWKQDEIDANESLLETEPPFQKPTSIKLSDLMSKKAIETPIIKQQQETPNILDITTLPKVETPQSKSLNEIFSKTKPIDRVLKTNPDANYINNQIDEIKNLTPKGEVQRENVNAESIKAKSHLYSITDSIKAGLNKNKISDSDFFDMVEGKIKATPKAKPYVDLWNKFTEELHTFRENPNLGKIETGYIHRIKESDPLMEELVNIGEGNWIKRLDLYLGSSKTRTGKLKEYSKDFDTVANSMISQSVLDKYGAKMMNVKDEEFYNKINERLTNPEELFRPNRDFNYVDESAIRQNEHFNEQGKKVIDVKVQNPDGTETIKEVEKIPLKYNVRELKIGKPEKHKLGLSLGQVETFDSVRDHISTMPNAKPLADAMRALRDSTDNIVHYVTEANKKTGEEAGKYIADIKGLKGQDRITFINNIKRLYKNIDASEREKYLIQIFSKNRKNQLERLIDTVGRYDLQGSIKDFLNYQIDLELKYGKMERTLADKITQGIITMFYNSQVLFNAKTALQQKTESLRIPAIYGAKVAARVIKQRALDKANGRNILRDYGFDETIADQYREFMGYKEVKNILSKVQDLFDKTGNAMVRATENSKNADFLTAAEIVGKDKGLKGEELYNFVRDELFKYGYILHKYNTPQLIRESNIMRLLLQYQQYNIKDINLMIDKANENAKGFKGAEELGKKITGITPLIFSKLLGIILMAGITGQSLKSLTKLKNLFNDAQIRFGPIVSVLWSTGNTIKDYIEETSKDVEDQSVDKLKYLESSLKKSFLRNVVLGGVQISKTSEAAKVLKKGYAETSTGKITYVAPTNWLNIIQGLLFGTSAFHESQDYYNDKDEKGYYGIGGIKGDLIKKQFELGNREEAINMINNERIRQEVSKAYDDRLTPYQKEIKKSFYIKPKKDEAGNVIPNLQDYMTIAGNKWNNFDLFQQEAEKQREIARRTGEPINPIYNLSPEQQRIVLRIQSLPPGSQDAKDLRDFSSDWIADYYADQRNYTEEMKRRGLFKDNPYYDDRIKVSPELQKKLDFFSSLPKGTGARSRFYKANPDVAEFFEASKKLTNEKRLMLGLLPVDYSKSNGVSRGSRSNFNYKLYYALKDIMKSYNDRKTLNKSLASLMAKRPKIKKLVDLMKMNKKKVDKSKSLDAILKEYQIKLFGKKKV